MFNLLIAHWLNNLCLVYLGIPHLENFRQFHVIMRSSDSRFLILLYPVNVADYLPLLLMADNEY